MTCWTRSFISVMYSAGVIPWSHAGECPSTPQNMLCPRILILFLIKDYVYVKKWRTLELKAYILFKCRRKVYYVILYKTSYPWAWRTLIALTGLSKLIWPCNVNIDDSKIFCQPILLDVSDLHWFCVALRKLYQY